MNRIPISWLHTFGYCEVQILLESSGVEARPVPAMEEGKKRHDELYRKHLAEATETLSVKQAIKKSSLEQKVLTAREVPVKGRKLIGLIDEVRFMPAEIWIIDDKPNDYPYYSNKLQVWGYCYAFEENYHPEKPLVGALRHRDKQEIIWDEPFTEENREEVRRSIRRIEQLLSSKRQPEPPQNPNKCRACRFRHACRFKPA